MVVLSLLQFIGKMLGVHRVSKLLNELHYRYACTRETDGIAVWNNDTQAMEGSPVSEIEFKCNEKGKYSLEVDSAGQYIVPKCLRRREM